MTHYTNEMVYRLLFMRGLNPMLGPKDATYENKEVEELIKELDEAQYKERKVLKKLLQIFEEDGTKQKIVKDENSDDQGVACYRP